MPNDEQGCPTTLALPYLRSVIISTVSYFKSMHSPSNISISTTTMDPSTLIRVRRPRGTTIASLLHDSKLNPLASFLIIALFFLD